VLRGRRALQVPARARAGAVSRGPLAGDPRPRWRRRPPAGAGAPRELTHWQCRPPSRHTCARADTHGRQQLGRSGHWQAAAPAPALPLSAQASTATTAGPQGAAPKVPLQVARLHVIQQQEQLIDRPLAQALRGEHRGVRCHRLVHDVHPLRRAWVDPAPLQAAHRRAGRPPGLPRPAPRRPPAARAVQQQRRGSLYQRAPRGAAGSLQPARVHVGGGQASRAAGGGRKAYANANMEE